MAICAGLTSTSDEAAPVRNGQRVAEIIVPEWLIRHARPTEEAVAWQRTDDKRAKKFVTKPAHSPMQSGRRLRRPVRRRLNQPR